MTQHADRVPEGLFTDVGLDQHVARAKFPLVHDLPALVIFHLIILHPIPGSADEEYRACILRAGEGGDYEIVDPCRFTAANWAEAEEKARKILEVMPFEHLKETRRFELRANSEN